MTAPTAICKFRITQMTPGLTVPVVSPVFGHRAASIRGWTPTSLAIDRVLRPVAANRTIRARFKSRCNVISAQQHASRTLRSLLER
jgi:hypothetical protein